MFTDKKNKNMPILDRDAILAASDIQTELVEVPEWGGSVFVKGMTGAERDRFESGIIAFGDKSEKIDMRDLRAKLCSQTIVNDKGKKLFTAADIKALSNKSAVALQRVFEVAQRLSGLTEADIKELEEGLEDRPFGDSVSD